MIYIWDLGWAVFRAGDLRPGLKPFRVRDPHLGLYAWGRGSRHKQHGISSHAFERACFKET